MTTISGAPAKTIPGPTVHNPLLGVYREAQREPLTLALRMMREHGDIVRMRSLFPFVVYQLTHPDDIDYVLRRNAQNYPKGAFIRPFKPLLGESLLTAEGDSWLRQRRLAQPAFHRRRLQALGDLMVRRSAELVELWQPIAAAGGQLDVNHEMMRVTMQIVAEALFSADVSQDIERVEQPFALLRDDILYRFFAPFVLPTWVPTARNRAFIASRRQLEELVYTIIRQRRASTEDPGDLLSMLIQARDEDTGEMMSDRQLRDEVLTLLLAGHETTAVALSWTWYLLAQHPEVEAHLHAELDSVLAGRAPTVEDLPKLPYTRMVLDETMRLYPPAYSMVRQSKAEDTIHGYRIPARAIIMLSQYATHRHPDFWEQPETFDPERWTPERSAGRPSFAYFPFGGGPRLCIGSHFALMEGQLVLATLAQRFRLQLVPGQTVVPDPSITLRPSTGIRMTLGMRN